MKIVALKTHQNIRMGNTYAAYFSIENAKPTHQGLKMEAVNHPLLGPLVVLECDAYQKQGVVKFIFPTNIEEMTVAPEVKAKKA